MSLRRGIEPIIATVILVAVALIIAVAVVGYLMGLFGGLAGGSPQISITNIALRKSDNNNLVLEFYVNNAGAGSDRLLKIEIISGSQIIGSTTWSSETSVGTIIPGNYKGWVTATVRNIVNNVNVGDTVIVKFYFEKSGTHTINVVISPKAS